MKKIALLCMFVIGSFNLNAVGNQPKVRKEKVGCLRNSCTTCCDCMGAICCCCLLCSQECIEGNKLKSKRPNNQ